ncbi:MAG: hypothetical protein EBU83_03470 [bacterium]|jgi:hypothetical protein|nr:hypothetical protein [Candidatus Aquidulcis sp.]
MPTNVAQSYPYKREGEAERAQAIAATLSHHEGLAEKLAAEALPYDGVAGDEAWAWRCRTVGCAGVLHTAGYAREKRAIVALCDGCGLIALR